MAYKASRALPVPAPGRVQGAAAVRKIFSEQGLTARAACAILCLDNKIWTKKGDIMARYLYTADINQTRRPRLAALMRKADCLLLDGKTAKGKADHDRLTVLLHYEGQTAARYEVARDLPAGEGDSERLEAIPLSQTAMDALAEVLVERAPKRGESSGRPRALTPTQELQAAKMRAEGASVRQIAAELGVSPATAHAYIAGRHELYAVRKKISRQKAKWEREKPPAPEGRES